MTQELGPGLISLPPPTPPSDVIASALFIPISAINKEHTGRKIRTVGQVIAYDIKSSLLLLCAVATEATGPLATVLVNVSIPLLGPTPALKALPQDDAHQQSTARPYIRRPEREALSLERGEFVTVVGWLESDQTKLSSQIEVGTAYLPPLSLGIDAIYIANSRPPPDGALYRGTIKLTS